MGGDLYQNQMMLLTQAVGKLEGTAEALNKGQAKIVRQLDVITEGISKASSNHVRTEADIENLNGEVEYVKEHIKDKVDPAIDDYNAKKNKAGGFLLGAGFLGGGVTITMKTVLEKFGLIGN